MALPATDNFNGTNGTALQTYNPSWTVVAGEIQIQSGGIIEPSVAYSNVAKWNADSFNANQYAKSLIKNWSTSAANVGVAVRVQTSDNCYYFYTQPLNGGNASFTGKNVNGTWTNNGSSRGTFANGDYLVLEVSGTTLTPKKNTTSLTTWTDSTFASGSAGVVVYYTGNTTPSTDDWEGGNLGGAAAEYFSGIDLGMNRGISRGMPTQRP